MSRLRLVALASAVLVTLLLTTSARADPNALWAIVHGLCVPNEAQHGDPAPCRLVSLQGGERAGYAVLKDLVGIAQVLLIPTAPIGGIESPELLLPDAPNYFAYAWQARRFVDGALRRALPRDAVSLAINSAWGRSQNQLHIHVDCIRPDVHAMLLRQQDAIGAHWAPLGAALMGHPYLAAKVEAGDLTGINPFKLLADGVRGAREDMGRYTIVVVGAVFAGAHPGFIILTDRADAGSGDRASGEELQDHACAIAR
jgi:CDP-diacylglycerol pyrophosphatase